jgi:hypothetical protein
MASLAEVMAGGPSPMTASGPSASPTEPGDPELPGEEVDEAEQEKRDYAWEFHQASNPEDAASALEAFVRLCR